MTKTKDDALRAAWVLKEQCVKCTDDDGKAICPFVCQQIHGNGRTGFFCSFDVSPTHWDLPPKPTTPDKWEALRKWALGCMDQCGELNLEEAQVTFAEVLCEMEKLEGFLGGAVNTQRIGDAKNG